MLNRDGLNEENWMLVAAQRTVEAGEEWMAIRKEALKVVGGILEEGKKGKQEVELGEGREGQGEKRVGRDDGEEGRGKRKIRKLVDDLPLGLYEPHGGIVHCGSILVVIS
jgi:chromatin structure-remodeling complex protein RSC7